MRAACVALLLVSSVARADRPPDEAVVRAELIAAIQRRDVDAVRRHVKIPFDAKDVKFLDAKCRSEFTGTYTMIEEHELASFVTCMAKMGVTSQSAKDGDGRWYTTYGPGSVLFLPVRDGKVVGMISFMIDGDEFQVTADAFAAHVKNFKRTIVPGGALKKAIDASADMRVVASVAICVDRRGKIGELDIEIEGDAAYERDVRAAARTWSVEPFRVGKQAVPACAVLEVGYPEQRMTAPVPADAPPAPPEPPPIVTPQQVPSEVLAPLRIQGTSAITPDEATKRAMRDAGHPHVVGSFKLCIDVTGAVTRVETLKTSGFEAYDQTLIRGMRTWKYRPYRVDGKPAPVCTMVSFVYRQTAAR